MRGGGGRGERAGVADRDWGREKERGGAERGAGQRLGGGWAGGKRERETRKGDWLKEIERGRERDGEGETREREG